MYRSKRTESYDKRHKDPVQTNFNATKFCANDWENQEPNVGEKKDDLGENYSNNTAESKDESDDDFHPELLGLIDDPGVIRFENLDDPSEIEIDLGQKVPPMWKKNWIRVSSENISDIIDDDSESFKDLLDQNFISRSLDDLHLHSSLSNDRSELISIRKCQRHYCYHILNCYDHHHGL